MKVVVPVVLGLFLLLPATNIYAKSAKTTTQQKFSAQSKLGYTYQLSFAAERLEAMKPLPATLRVTDPAGQPVPGAKLSCVLTMPAMAMPLNSPSIKAGDLPGDYQCVVLLTMSGLWEMGVDATYGSGAQDRVVLSFVGVNPGSGESDDAVNKRLEELFHEKDKDADEVKY